MSAESPRHVRSGGPLIVPSQPPSDRSIIDAVSGFINDVTLSSSSTVDPKDVIQWARFETADINEPTPEGDSENDISPLLLILGYGAGVQVWLIPPTGDAQEVLSWRQGTVRVLRILPTPHRGDCFVSKRPLIALCDSASPGPAFCSLSFISIRGGEQVKSIKFKNPILDVLANKRSVVVSFSERFAVFDAGTLEDRMAVTTCYPCPCPLGGSLPINPLALGDRWLAYADKKLNQAKRSSGGCEAEGVTSYTATVLHAAKSLSKGLRGLGESVAHSLGGRSTSQSPSPPNTDIQQPGIVTIIDIEGSDEDDVQDSTEEPSDPIVAHFVAHSEAIIALKFDASGMLLITADRRGHDFHVFRVNPHPCGPSLASVHHLYILHRGDTTAKVQDIAISVDSRWAAVSSLRGTTHLFAISPYGGACGVRTHTQPRVVNRLSRFQRSAGLPIHAHAPKRPSGSPVSVGVGVGVGGGGGDGVGVGAWFPNPRLPPFPLPLTCAPLAQLRPTANIPTHTITRNSSGRQRLSSLSEESNSAPLLARAQFGPPPPPPLGAHSSLAPLAPSPPRTPAVAALYLVAANGALMHLLLHPKPCSGIPKEKICDESPIEVEVEGVAQWQLQRPPSAADLLAPLPPSNPLLHPPACRRCSDVCMSEEERWLSQVEIVTHAGPHRRLWMGPQFVFKTYNCTGSSSSLSEAETVEVESGVGRGVARSNPVNMPGVRPIVPVLIDSGSASSLEHSPSDSCRRKSLLAESGRATSVCDVQLREDLAEAMKEDHGCDREEGRGPCVGPCRGRWGRRVERSVAPLGWVVRPADPPPAGPAPASASAPAPAPNAEAEADADPDAATRPNSDEALFRPVVRAAAPPPAAPDLLVRPLPRTTTIPVQTVRPCPEPRPYDEPLPLTTAVVIPAALTAVPPWSHLDDSDSECAILREENNGVSVDGPPERGASVSELPPTAAASESLPNANRPPADIQPVARDRIKKSPTSMSSDRFRENNDNYKLSSKNDDMNAKYQQNLENVISRVERKSDEIPESTKERLDVNIDCNKISLSKVKLQCDLLNISNKNMKKDNKDIQPKEIKSNKPEVLNNREKIEELLASGKRRPRRSMKPARTADKLLGLIDELLSKDPKDVNTDEAGQDLMEIKSIPNVESVKSKEKPIKKELKKIGESRIKRADLKKNMAVENNIALNLMTVHSLDSKEILSKPKPEVVYETAKIKTEDQAWDMLINEPERPIFTVYQPPMVSEKAEQLKPKPKRNRKVKKTEEEQQAKADEDSFVEIHTIEDKQQSSSGELVSISELTKDSEVTASYLSKTKKSRATKSLEKTFTLEKNNQRETTPDIWSASIGKPRINLAGADKYEDDIEILHETTEEDKNEKYSDMFKNIHKDVSPNASISLSQKDISKSKKSKSLSPLSDSRKSAEKEIKDVYVIDSTKEEFPEIQITTKASKKEFPDIQIATKASKKEFPDIQIATKASKKEFPEIQSTTKTSKMRKRSVEKIDQDKELVDKPVKSWSSIAATKCEKKSGDNEVKLVSVKPEIVKIATDSEENENKLSDVSLQEKLVELCKRTDIMVATCDAPSELNFVEEHHSLLDVPESENIEFKLDEHELEVMKDSLMEANEDEITSPIYNINRDKMWSVIDTKNDSLFNLIDMEKALMPQSENFSVVDKVTKRDFKVDDEIRSGNKDAGVMEKSSEDDITSSALSADSDKEDRKSAGACNANTTSSKQSCKSKKSRRKKK